LFMSLIFFMVYMSTQYPIDLVEEDYYPKGLKYQERIDEISNARPVASQVRAFQNSDAVVVIFPEINPDTGTITFYRPSNIHLDRVYEINTDSLQQMSFPKSEFKKKVNITSRSTGKKTTGDITLKNHFTSISS